MIKTQKWLYDCSDVYYTSKTQYRQIVTTSIQVKFHTGSNIWRSQCWLAYSNTQVKKEYLVVFDMSQGKQCQYYEVMLGWKLIEPTPQLPTFNPIVMCPRYLTRRRWSVFSPCSMGNLCGAIFWLGTCCDQWRNRITNITNISCSCGHKWGMLTA